MAAEIRISISGQRELERVFEGGRRGARRFKTSIQSEMRAAGASVANASRAISRGLAGIAGVGGAISFAKLANDTVTFTDRLNRLGIQAGRTREETATIGREVAKVSDVTGKKGSEIIGALEKIAEKGISLQDGVGALQAIGIAAQASGTDLSSMGEVAADLFEKFKIDSKDALSAFALLVNQGKAGAFELRSLASLAPRAFAAAQGFGSGIKGVRATGALLQVFRKGTGSPEQSVTAFERFAGELVEKHSKLRGIGVEVFADRGRKKLRSLDDIVRDLVPALQKAGPTVVQKIFGQESIRGISALLGGGVAEFDRFFNATDDARQLMADFGRANESAASKIGRFTAKAEQVFVRELGPVVDSLSGKLDGFGRALGIAARHPFLTAGGFGSLFVGKQFADAMATAVGGALAPKIGAFFGSLALPAASIAIAGAVTLAAGAVILSVASIAGTSKFESDRKPIESGRRRGLKAAQQRHRDETSGLPFHVGNVVNETDLTNIERPGTDLSPHQIELLLQKGKPHGDMGRDETERTIRALNAEGGQEFTGGSVGVRIDVTPAAQELIQVMRETSGTKGPGMQQRRGRGR